MSSAPPLEALPRQGIRSRSFERFASKPGRAFVWGFVFLCALHVPMLLYFGAMVIIAPVSYFVGDYLFDGFLRGGCLRDWRVSLAILVYICVYMLAFAGIGALIGWLLRKTPWSILRRCLMVAILLLPIAASFARVLTYGGFFGRGGTYTFWEAVVRYQEKGWR